MITIARLTNVTDDAVTELSALASELRGEEVHATRESIEAIVKNEGAILMSVQDDGRIIGMATLILIPKVGKLVSLLEDVVVSEKYRGQRLGKTLIEAVIEEAKKHGVRSISLTSRPSRVAAQALYQKFGWKKRETDAFKLSL
jgi:ribosomal protein S18 acetylase RimI-like enzyme